jgi:hypothetical protein
MLAGVQHTHNRKLWQKSFVILYRGIIINETIHKSFIYNYQ